MAPLRARMGAKCKSAATTTLARRSTSCRQDERRARRRRQGEPDPKPRAKSSTVRCRISSSGWRTSRSSTRPAARAIFSTSRSICCLDLEKEVITYAAGARRESASRRSARRSSRASRSTRYAQQLAQVVIWIGYLQWMHHNGFPARRNPCWSRSRTSATWTRSSTSPTPSIRRSPNGPKADFIVGNPPFLGGKLLRTNLGDEYVDAMFSVWDEPCAARGRSLLLLV